MDLKYEIPDNSICVDGKFYQLSGWQELENQSPSISNSEGPVKAGYIDVPFPYIPPEGYTFSYSDATFSSGYNVIQTGNHEQDNMTRVRFINVLSYGSNSIHGVRWTLVPKPPEED